MSQSVYRILCVGCRKSLYQYRGDFTGFFRPSAFFPFPGVPKPTPGKAMLCPFCKEPWYCVNARTGGPIVMTDQGWKPREPEGKRDLGALRSDSVRAASKSISPEMPPEMRKGGASDWVDPLAAMRDRAAEKAKKVTK